MELIDDIKILLVEDDVHSRLFLQTVIKSKFKNYIIAEDGQDGLNKFKEHRPDMVISDIAMPNMDGLEMSKNIKAINPDTHIIITTAFDNKDTLKKAIEVGVNSYVIKPIEFTSLKAAINQAVTNVRLKLKIDSQTTYIKTLSEALEHSSSMICLIDSDFKISYVNKSMVEKSGHAKENIIGKSIFDFTSENEPESLKEITKALDEQQSIKGELLFSVEGGELIWVYYTITPIINSENKVKSFVIVLDDISDKKEEEFQLKETRDLLEDEVRKRTQELSEINQKLLAEIEKRKQYEKDLIKAKDIAESANNAKSMFLAKVSHELRTPMNGVLGMTSVLLDTELSEKQLNSLKIVKKSADGLLKIINDLLDFSKLESGKFQIKYSVFDFGKLINSTINMMSNIAVEKELSLKYKIENEVPLILKSDPDRIRQVIVNLLGNAIKFTDSGYVLLDAKLISMQSSNAIIQISITDTGSGIPPEKEKQLFESFSQLESTLTRKKGGTGLGLAISKEIVEQLGGEIWYESTEGKGTIFYFTFKSEVVDQSTKIIKENRTYEDPNNLKNARILIAEDTDINIAVIKNMLEDDYLLTFAKNGEIAVKKFYEQEFDLIFMDIHMPEMNGMEATKMIRSHEFNQKRERTPIICLTANVLEEQLEQFLASGMDDVLTKPFKIDDMNKILNKHLKKTTTDEGRFHNKYIDLKGLLNSINHNEELLEKLLTYFSDNYAKTIQNIRESIEAKNFQQAHELSHKFKSELINFVKREFTDKVAYLELMSKTSNFDEGLKILNEIEPELNLINQSLKQHTIKELIRKYG